MPSKANGPKNKTITLGEIMPREMTYGEYSGTRAYSLRDEPVLKQVDGTVVPWPGPQRNVFFWCILANGLAVAWNENPAQGWSFPVIRVDENGNRLKKRAGSRATPV